jgi:hypothetical protein
MSTIFVNPILTHPFGESGDGPINVIRYYGEKTTPRNIQQQRRNNLSTMRRFGTPVVVKHMWNDRDVRAGIAEPSLNYSSVYKQTRHDDPLSHGIGFSSVEKSDNEWVSPQGALVVSETSPGAGYVPAPKYRGYGPGYLTYAILPDVSEDVFKLSEVGALIKVQQATVQMGWFPEMNDNDLLAIVEIDNSERVIDVRERFLLKMTAPASMRGLDRQGRLEADEDFGNRHITDQSFEMTRIPIDDSLYNVEFDR